MSELEPIRGSGSHPDEAVIAFQTDEPIPASDLARLIQILAKEYSKINRGHTLVVSSIHTGSLFIYIKDWMLANAKLVKDSGDYLESGAALAKFIDTLRGVLSRSKEQPRALEGRRAGFQAARAIVKLAAERGAAVELDYNIPGGERLSVRLASKDVQEIHATSQPSLAALPQSTTAVLAAPPPLLQLDRNEQAERHAAAIQKAIGDAPLDASAERAITAVLAAMDGLGMGALFEDIAATLAAQGRSDLARLVTRTAVRFRF